MLRSFVWLTCGLLLTAGRRFALTYLSMPAPGSQTMDSIGFVRLLAHTGWLAYGLGAACLAMGLAGIWRQRKSWWPVATAVVLLLLGVFVFRFAARSDPTELFRPLSSPQFATGTSEDLPPETLVLGISLNGETKAYPIRLVAYHHVVHDQVGGEPIAVTYCTMCRSGRLYRTLVDDRHLTFRTVAANRFNSVLEDLDTRTWWYQASGRAAAGPLEGTTLQALPTDQMTLARWLQLHPQSLVMQPDEETGDWYQLYRFHEFDSATPEESAERGPGWEWLVVVHAGEETVAYPWSALSERRLLQGERAGVPWAVHLDGDLTSFRAWDRRVGDATLTLTLTLDDSGALIDEASGSRFSWAGEAIEGPLAGERLERLQADQELRHSFERFVGGELLEPSAGSATRPAAEPVSEEDSAQGP